MPSPDVHVRMFFKDVLVSNHPLAFAVRVYGVLGDHCNSSFCSVIHSKKTVLNMLTISES